MNFVDEQVVAAAGGLAIDLVNRAHEQAADGEEKEQAGIGEADPGDGIKRPQEKRGRGADGDSQRDENGDPPKGGEELGG